MFKAKYLKETKQIEVFGIKFLMNSKKKRSDKWPAWTISYSKTNGTRERIVCRRIMALAGDYHLFLRKLRLKNDICWRSDLRYSENRSPFLTADDLKHLFNK